MWYPASLEHKRPPPNMQPCSITLDGKTIKFNNPTELWNWCIQNKPEWVKLPNSPYPVGADEVYNLSDSGLDYVKLVTSPESYSSIGCIDE